MTTLKPIIVNVEIDPNMLNQPIEIRLQLKPKVISPDITPYELQSYLKSLPFEPNTGHYCVCRTRYIDLFLEKWGRKFGYVLDCSVQTMKAVPAFYNIELQPKALTLNTPEQINVYDKICSILKQNGHDCEGIIVFHIGAHDGSEIGVLNNLHLLNYCNLGYLGNNDIKTIYVDNDPNLKRIVYAKFDSEAG